MTRQLHTGVPTSETPGCRLQRLNIQMRDLCHPLNSCGAHPKKAWATGVLFEREDTALLVEILPNGREIELRARGLERKALLSVVAADLDALNDSFKGLREKVDKRIPCNCEGCRAASVPQFFGEKALLRRKEHGVLKVQCESSFELLEPDRIFAYHKPLCDRNLGITP